MSNSTILDDAVMASITDNVTRADILGHSRKPAIVQARWRAMRIARDAGLPFTAIGDYFGRDHTSVMHAVKKTAPAITFKSVRA